MTKRRYDSEHFEEKIEWVEQRILHHNDQKISRIEQNTRRGKEGMEEKRKRCLDTRMDHERFREEKKKKLKLTSAALTAGNRLG